MNLGGRLNIFHVRLPEQQKFSFGRMIMQIRKNTLFTSIHVDFIGETAK